MSTKYSLNTPCGGYNLFCSVGETAGSNDIQSTVTKHLAAQFSIVSFEAHHDRHRHSDLCHSANDAFRDHVATDDPTEDIDQNSLNIGVGKDDLERFSNAFLGRTAAHVEEVRRRAAVQLDDGRLLVQAVMNNDMEADSVFRVRDDVNTLSIEPLPYSLEE